MLMCTVIFIEVSGPVINIATFLKLNSARNSFAGLHTNIPGRVLCGPQFRKCSSGTKVSNACEKVAHPATLWAMTFSDWHELRHYHDEGDILESGMMTMIPGKENVSPRNSTPVHVRPQVSIHGRPGPSQLLFHNIHRGFLFP